MHYITIQFHFGNSKIHTRLLDPSNWDWAIEVLRKHGACIVSAFSEV